MREFTAECGCKYDVAECLRYLARGEEPSGITKCPPHQREFDRLMKQARDAGQAFGEYVVQKYLELRRESC